MSTATGIIITRANKDDQGSFSNSAVEQLFNQLDIFLDIRLSQQNQ